MIKELTIYLSKDQDYNHMECTILDFHAIIDNQVSRYAFRPNHH